MTSPNWNTTLIDGVEYLVITTAQFRVPLDWDPSSNMFIAVAAPNAAVPIGTGGFPALVTGQTGPPPTLSPIINFTALLSSDPTPDSASWTVIGTTPITYQLNLALHIGAPGAAGGSTVMTATDVVGSGSATPNQMLVVNPTSNGFIYDTQRVGDRFVPATIVSCPAGNPLFTQCSVPVAAQKFDWRPEVSGATIVTATGLDLTVDVVARLSNTNSDGGQYTGNELGRCIGLPAPGFLAAPIPVSMILESGPPAGSADAWDRVPQGLAATIFFNLERQTGSSTMTAPGGTARFKVRVAPCPTDL